jgi:HlyD family secretion protein
MRRSALVNRVILAVVVVATLAALAYGVFRYRQAKAVPEVQYRTATVEKRRITSRITASGALQATVTVQIGAQVSGRISTLGADFNSEVKKGQVIARLDPQLFAAEVERAKANHASAKAGVVRAEAEERDAKLSLARARALREQGIASAAELQAAETAVSVTTAASEVARAALQQTSAALNQAKVNLSFTEIRSPIDGVVISRDVDVGQTVASSLQAPILFTIAEDLKKMEVHTSVAEGDVGRIAPGMGATFTVDAFPGQRFRGVVKQIRNAAQTVQNVVTYNAVIDVDNADLRLRPGMTATVTIVHAQKEEALAVPNAALRFRPAGGPSASGPPRGRARPEPKQEGDGGAEEDQARILHVLRGGEPVPVTVALGLSDGTVTEIVSGDLREGDPVVVETMASNQGGGGGGRPPGGSPRMGRGMF